MAIIPTDWGTEFPVYSILCTNAENRSYIVSSTPRREREEKNSHADRNRRRHPYHVTSKKSPAAAYFTGDFTYDNNTAVFWHRIF
jgi:hypothetical protein